MDRQRVQGSELRMWLHVPAYYQPTMGALEG